MFCQNCGSQNADNSAFCSKCGTALNAPAQQPVQQPMQPPVYTAQVQQQPVQQPMQPPVYAAPAQQPYGAPVQQPYGTPMQQPYYGAPMQKKMGKGALIAIISSIVVIVAAAAVLLIVLLGGSSDTPEAVAEKAAKALMEYDVDGIADLIHKDALDLWVEENGFDSLKEMREEVGEEGEEEFAELAEDLGSDDFEFFYEVGSPKKIKGSELSNLQELYADEFDLEVTAAYKVSVSIDVEGPNAKLNKKQPDRSTTAYLVEIDGTWYVDVFNSMSISASQVSGSNNDDGDNDDDDNDDDDNDDDYNDYNDNDDDYNDYNDNDVGDQPAATQAPAVEARPVYNTPEDMADIIAYTLDTCDLDPLTNAIPEEVLEYIVAENGFSSVRDWQRTIEASGQEERDAMIEAGGAMWFNYIGEWDVEAEINEIRAFYAEVFDLKVSDAKIIAIETVYEYYENGSWETDYDTDEFYVVEIDGVWYIEGVELFC